MKTIKVVAAVIKAVNKNGEDIIFATDRKSVRVGKECVP